MAGNAAERTGAKDERYDLVSVLYHTLQEAETITTYIDDARRAGDQELVDFLQSVQEQDRQRAKQANRLLADRLVKASA